MQYLTKEKGTKIERDKERPLLIEASKFEFKNYYQINALMQRVYEKNHSSVRFVKSDHDRVSRQIIKESELEDVSNSS